MSDAERARLRDIAFRLGRRLTSKDDYLNQISDDIAAKAFEELLKAFTRTTINNPEAFMTWKMKKLIADALRQRKAEVSRLQIWN
jgi:DNA-directed RNA polymerase specialized sigma24 family protein